MATMTDDHKAALAQGRNQGRAVKLYLEAVAKPVKRGRRRTRATVESQLETTRNELATAHGIEKLELTQRRMDLEAELAEFDLDPGDITELEEAFVAVAAMYAARKGLSRAAFKAVGVPTAVLKRAGI